ncbi:unnamed protein product [Prorocentrum cordatum]|uniref:Uncharacterized protein n=1 Tax=Prorocentrum cordatum TaxID=2364126 RepID=A0ABN9WEU9_9DINO|nr:unnamed protein product [Polarella glacialis]
MSKRFVPVSDPEKPRTEQDEEGLRKHRQFDTPHAKLKDDLNKPRAPREDNNHPGKPTGKLAKDKDQLWRKKEEIHAKNNLFDKQKTWGRETFDYSNPEEARADGKGDRKKKPGEVHWGVKGSFGGRGEDTGVLILQRGEVDQRMELNDKGLWVKKKKEAGADDGADKPKVDEAAQRDLLRAAPSREDPRLEAAKQKGRGGPDAAAKALQALQARRAVEKKVQEEVGMRSGAADARPSGRAVTLNSSSQQMRPARRLGGTKRWQGVQRTDEEAREVVGKAEKSATIGKDTQAAAAATSAADVAPDPLRRRERSKSPEFAWMSGSDRSASRSRSAARRGGGSGRPPRLAAAEAADGDGEAAAGDIEVDFF